MAKFAYDFSPVPRNEDAPPSRLERSAFSLNAVTKFPHEAPHWTAPVPEVLYGPNGIRLRTLRDAFDLLAKRAPVTSQPDARRNAAHLLIRAARTGNPNDVAIAAGHVSRYLALERAV